MLKGGTGNDTLAGSYGIDTLTGNGGSDNFILQRGGVEKVTDFTPGTDKLWIGTFNGTATPGATFFSGTLAAAPNGTEAVYDPATGFVYFDPDGTNTGTAPAALVGILSPGLNIQSSDVVIDPMVQAIAGTPLDGKSSGGGQSDVQSSWSMPMDHHQQHMFAAGLLHS